MSERPSVDLEAAAAKLDQIVGIADCIAVLAVHDRVDQLKAESLYAAATAIMETAEAVRAMVEEAMEAHRAQTVEPKAAETTKKPRLVPIRKTAAADAEPEQDGAA
jgi:hypothetical protein